MDVRDRLFLGPIDKYRKYRRYPWKMILGLTLVVLTSINVLVIVAEFTNYSYSQMTVFNTLFLNSNVPLTQAQGSDTSLTTTFHLFDIVTLLKYIGNTVNIYTSINSLTFDSYRYSESGSNTPPSIRMDVSYLNNDAFSVPLT